MALDSNGYPTEESLKAIESYDLLNGKVQEFLALIRENWWMPDWGFVPQGKHLHLHTGGWSGNESTIGAMKRNRLFWAMYWKRTDRGGHYTFDMPPNVVRALKKLEEHG